MSWIIEKPLLPPNLSSSPPSPWDTTCATSKVKSGSKHQWVRYSYIQAGVVETALAVTPHIVNKRKLLFNATPRDTQTLIPTLVKLLLLSSVLHPTLVSFIPEAVSGEFSEDEHRNFSNTCSTMRKFQNYYSKPLAVAIPCGSCSICHCCAACLTRLGTRPKRCDDGYKLTTSLTSPSITAEMEGSKKNLRAAVWQPTYCMSVVDLRNALVTRRCRTPKYHVQYIHGFDGSIRWFGWYREGAWLAKITVRFPLHPLFFCKSNISISFWFCKNSFP